MLRIRAEQMDQLRVRARMDYRQSLVDDFHRRYPNDFELLGREQVALAIHTACENANQLGFNAKTDVRRFVTLALMFGTHFHRDPLLQWAPEVLYDPAITHSAIKIHHLCAAAEHYLERTAGPHGEHYAEALLRVSNMTFAQLPGLVRQAKSADEALWVLLSHSFPTQIESVSPVAYRKFHETTFRTIKKYGLACNEGFLVTGLIMSLCNSFFAFDPLHAWVRPILSAEAEAQAKARQLWDAAIAFLRRHPVVSQALVPVVGD